MIAKIIKGSNFKGVVNYIFDKEKDARILICDGLFGENKEIIASSFEAQTRMNPKVTKPVGHISLAFHKEDEHRLTDRAMAGLALEYLKEMEINNTKQHANPHRAPLRQGASARAYRFQPYRQQRKDNQRPKRAATQHTCL